MKNQRQWIYMKDLMKLVRKMIEEAEITRKLPVWISGIKRAIM